MNKKKKRKARLKKERELQQKSLRVEQTQPFELTNRAELAPYDETLLESARTRWQLGDWSRLAAIEKRDFSHHPQREKVAVLVAAAHFQLGDFDAGSRYLRLAQDWGCSRRLIAQMMISGTHNSLACAQRHLGRQEETKVHFRAALETGGVLGDAELLAEVRFHSQEPHR